MTVSMKLAAPGATRVSVSLKGDELDFSPLLAPDGKPQPDVTLRIEAKGVTLNASFRGKNFRKVVKGIPPGSYVIVQGKLGPNNTVLEAGIAIQLPKEEPAPVEPNEAMAAS